MMTNGKLSGHVMYPKSYLKANFAGNEAHQIIVNGTRTYRQRCNNTSKVENIRHSSIVKAKEKIRAVVEQDLGNSSIL